MSLPTPAHSFASVAGSDFIQKQALRKVARRVLPFSFVLYVAAYLDRANVAFAKVQMSKDLGFSEAVFGFGAGIFFLGYLLLEIPGALIVQRWSARKWIARILLTWGLCSTLTGFVTRPSHFFAARLLLGLAEAGFFPGMLVYLARWFPSAFRARAMSMFVLGIPISLLLGAPLSGWLLQVHWLNLPGWRWVFIVQGIPAVILGVVTWFYLSDWPEEAQWLTKQERISLRERIENESDNILQATTFRSALRSRGNLLLASALFTSNIGITSYLIWLPSLLQKYSGLSSARSSLLSAIPFLCATLAIIVVGRASDRKGERITHTAIPMALSALWYALTLIQAQPFGMVLTWLSLAGASMFAWVPAFWALASTLSSESAAAASFGLINSAGALGSFVGPTLVGIILSRTGSTALATVFAVGSLAVGALCVTGVRPRRTAL
jgi:ACS family tartrate transporter-like MFS transporter